jgi:hypothetical protein
MEIIVTDLTHFKNEDKICVAGICLENGLCVRPMPYLSKKMCRELNMLPGGKLVGTFTPTQNSRVPHIEDHNYEDLKFAGAASAEEFKSVLEASLEDSVESGFDVDIADNQKFFPIQNPPTKSIITIHPKSFSIVADKYSPNKPRAVFSDSKDKTFYYLSITDLGFYEVCEDQKNSEEWRKSINCFLRSQKDIFIRLGLSRAFKSKDGREGYWIQVNGIYTFPEYLENVRCHRK